MSIRNSVRLAWSKVVGWFRRIFRRNINKKAREEASKNLREVIDKSGLKKTASIAQEKAVDKVMSKEHDIHKPIDHTIEATIHRPPSRSSSPVPTIENQPDTQQSQVESQSEQPDKSQLQKKLNEEWHKVKTLRFQSARYKTKSGEILTLDGVKLDKKQDAIKEYREKCDNLKLLINTDKVNSVKHKNALGDLSREIMEYAYKYSSGEEREELKKLEDEMDQYLIKLDKPVAEIKAENVQPQLEEGTENKQIEIKAENAQPQSAEGAENKQAEIKAKPEERVDATIVTSDTNLRPPEQIEIPKAADIGEPQVELDKSQIEVPAIPAQSSSNIVSERVNNLELITAAANGDLDKMKELIMSAADVNVTDENGRSAIMYAAYNGHIDAVKMLLENRKTEFYGTDNNDTTAVMYAAMKGHIDIVDLLIEKAKQLDFGDMSDIINFNDKNRMTALSYAVHRGDIEVASALMERGANPDTLDASGYTPLMHAIDKSYTDEKYDNLEIMLLNSEDVNINKSFINSAKVGNLQVLEELIDIGEKAALENLELSININYRDGKGNTALMYAVAYGHQDIIKKLLEKGATVSLENKQGKTAMDFTVDEKIKALLQEKLDKEPKKGKKAHTVHTELSDEDQRKNILRSIEARKKPEDDKKSNISDEEIAKLNELLLDEAAIGRVDFIDQLLDNGALVNVPDPDERNKAATPLMHAVMGGYIEVAKKLLNRGAKIDEKDYYGTTALMYAAANDNKEMVDFLLSKNIKQVEIKDHDGNTAFIHAATNGSKEVVKLLLQKKDFKIAEWEIRKALKQLPYDQDEIRDILQTALAEKGKPTKHIATIKVATSKEATEKLANNFAVELGGKLAQRRQRPPTPVSEEHKEQHSHAVRASDGKPDQLPSSHVSEEGLQVPGQKDIEQLLGKLHQAEETVEKQIKKQEHSEEIAGQEDKTKRKKHDKSKEKPGHDIIRSDNNIVSS